MIIPDFYSSKGLMVKLSYYMHEEDESSLKEILQRGL
jgi:hypothetical protein